MKNKLKYMSVAVIVATAITGCKKDKDDMVAPPPPLNEPEVITTLRLNFTSTGGTETKVFNFIDADGDGGGAPVITADALSNDTVYNVAILVLDESGAVADTISNEIANEDEDHQFFFQVSSANATVAYADMDSNGKPIGLSTIWTIGAVSSGTVIVTLRHEPNKDGAGVSSGDITNAGGETDIEVTFPVVIQ